MMDLDDLDDFLDEVPKPKPTVASRAPINKYGAGNNTTTLRDEFDDFEDAWGPATKSAQNSKPPTIIPASTPTEPKTGGYNMWGGAKTDLKPSGSRLGLNSSFGGSQKGSRKSKAEEDAEETDALLADVLGDNEPSKPQPTGTFKDIDKDNDGGWGKINKAPNSRGSMAADDDFDMIDNILDDIEEKKGIESTNNARNTGHQKKESLWSVGFGAGKGQASSRHGGDEELDELDELEAGGER